MYEHAVVPLDGSAVAEAIVPMIVKIAGPLEMDVVLLRVVQPLPQLVADGARHVVMDPAQERQLDAEEYLAALAVELRNKGIRVETLVRRGIPSAEILAGAREVGADLIAMTTHGRSGLGRLLFGSVAEDVLRHADIPVFLMRCTEADVARRTTEAA
jgi:nucleotide-binding universal stress UspA family protein